MTALSTLTYGPVALVLRGLRPCASMTDVGGTDGSPIVPGAGESSERTPDWSDPNAETPVRDEEPSAQAASPEGDEDDDPDELEHVDASDPEAIAKLRKALNHQKRQNRKLRPIAQQVKGLNLQELQYQARSYQEFQAQIAQNPKLKAFFGLGDESASSDAARSPTPSFEYDGSSLPYDPSANPINQHLAKRDRDLAEVQHTLKAFDLAALSKRLEQIESHVGTIGQREIAREQQATQTQWRTAIESAAEKIPNVGVRKQFKELLAREYVISRNSRARIDPSAIVQKHLADLGLPQVAKQQQKAVTAQRMAEANKSLPRPGAMVGGTPASARDKSKERLADVHRRVMGRTPGR